MAERQRYIYQGQNYDLSAELSQEEALERIKRHLSENAETTTVAEPEADVEPSGATGFEETDRQVRTATNTENWFEKYINQQAEVNQVISEAQTGVGKISAMVAAETVAAVPQIAYNLSTVVAPETVASIKQEVSDFGPTKAVRNFVERIDPKQYLNENEKIAAELATYLSFAGAGVKITKEITGLLVKKFGKRRTDEIINKGVLPKITRALKKNVPLYLGANVGLTHAGVQLRPDENTFAAFINNSPSLRKRFEELKNNPEKVAEMEEFILSVGNFVDKNSPEWLKDISARLKINPEDPEALMLKKRYVEEFGGNLILGLPIDAAILLVQGGVGAFRSTVKKLAATKVPTTEKNTTLVSSEVVETPEGEIVQKNTFNTKIPRLISSLRDKAGTINTKAARGFASEAGLPPEVAQLIKDKGGLLKEGETYINFEIKQLRKAQKKFKVSDADFEKWMANDKSIILPDEFIKLANKSRDKIQANNDSINDLLGLVGDKRINVVVDGEKVYYHRMYEASFNTKYYPEIKAGLDAINAAEKSKSALPDNIITTKILNARDYFRKLGVAEEDLDLTIRTAVQRLAQNKNESSGLLEAVFSSPGGRGSSLKADKIMKGRKLDVVKDAPLLELLGALKDPMIKFETTLTAQNKLLSEIKFMTSVAKYAEDAAGKVIPMGGLIPKLPIDKTRIIKKRGIGDNSGEYQSLDFDLGEWSKQRLNSFGTDTNILKEIWTTKQFGKYLDFGLDLTGPRGANSGFVSGIRHGAALAQAKETILDVPAYGLNTAGAITNTVFNGTALNLKNLATGREAVNTIIKGLRANDPKAVEKLAFYKRKNLIEQDVTGAALLENANVTAGNPKNWYKKTMKGAGRAYSIPDMIAKTISYEAKLAELKKVYPFNPKQRTVGGRFLSKTAHNENLEDQAIAFVTGTMPTYNMAMPFAREVSKTPLFGNYVLFTTETARTYKNIIKDALKQTGIAGARALRREPGSGRHLVMASKQLAGATAMMAGGYQTIDYFNSGGSVLGFRLVDAPMEKKIINKDTGKEETVLSEVNPPVNLRAMSIVAPDFAKGTSPLITRQFELDETERERLTTEQKEYWDNLDGFRPQIRGEFLNSNTTIYTDYINAAGKLLVGKALGGSKDIDSTVLDDAEKQAALQIAGNFMSPKFLVQGLLNAYMGVDSNGKPLYEKLPGETFQDKMVAGADALYKNIFEGGTIKGIQNILASGKAEDLMGQGLGERASGFPLTLRTAQLAATGQRFTTMLPEKSFGFSIYQDIKEIAKSKSAYAEFIRKGLGTAPQKRTDEDILKVVDMYKELQDRKFTVLNKMARKMDTFEKFTYVRKYRDPKTKKIKKELKTLNMFGIFKAASNSFKNSPNLETLTALLADSKNELSTGIFIPDAVVGTKASDKQRELLMKQGFSMEQTLEIVNQQLKIYSSLLEKRIFEKDDKKKEEAE